MWSQAPGHGFLEEMSWAELKERLKVLQAQHERTEIHDCLETIQIFGIGPCYDMSSQESGWEARTSTGKEGQIFQNLWVANTTFYPRAQIDVYDLNLSFLYRITYEPPFQYPWEVEKEEMLTEKIQLLAKVREQAREQMMENRDHIRSLSVFGVAIGEHLRLRLHWSEVMFRCCSDMYMSCEESKNSKLRSSTLADASPVEWHSLHFVSDSISRLVISPAILVSFLRKDRQRGDVVIEVAARLESKKKEKKETAAKSPVCVWSLKCDEYPRHTYVEYDVVEVEHEWSAPKWEDQERRLRKELQEQLGHEKWQLGPAANVWCWATLDACLGLRLVWVRIATKQQFQMNNLEALEGQKNADTLLGNEAQFFKRH